jgi:hypothetical protein
VIKQSYDREIDVNDLRCILTELGFRKGFGIDAFYPLVLERDVDDTFRCCATLKRNRKQIEIIVSAKLENTLGSSWLIKYLRGRKGYLRNERDSMGLIRKKLESKGIFMTKEKSFDLMNPAIAVGVIAFIFIAVVAYAWISVKFGI